MKKTVSIALALCLVCALSVTAFAAGGGAIGVEDVNSILTALTGQISVSTIMLVLVAAIASAIGFVFMWWAVRKLLATFFSGFRKGKASV